MAQIISNIFSFDELNEEVSSKDLIEINKLDTNIDSISEYENLGNSLLEEARTILHTCKGYEGITFEEVILNKTNFQANHYDLMNNRYLIVMYDGLKKEYKYITSSGKVYITSDSNLISIIHNIPKPIKLTCTYVPLQGDEKIFSFSLLSRVLYNIYAEEPSTLIKYYLKPTVTLNNESEHSILYHIFNIYPKLEHLLNVQRYFKYVHLEQYVYNVSKKALLSQELNTDVLSLAKSNYIKELSMLLKETGIDISAVKSKPILLTYIDNHAELNLYPTINKRVLTLLQYTDMTTIIKDIEAITLIDYIQEHKTYPSINTISKYGDVSEGIPIPFNLSDRVLIKGSYNDMFFKILADITYNKEYIKIASKGPLIYELIKNTVEDMQELYACYCEYYIQAICSGCKTDNEILNYFKINLYTSLSVEDLESIKEIYNNELSGLREAIEKYNMQQYCNYSPILLNHQELDPLSTSIYDKKRFVIKHLVQEIDLYCNDFNKKNKSKIDIVYFDSDNIYILADEEALNIAIDTLTRVMPHIFNKYCPRVSPTCYVEMIDKKFN